MHLGCCWAEWTTRISEDRGYPYPGLTASPLGMKRL